MRILRSSITHKSPEAEASEITAIVTGNTAFAFDLYQAINDFDSNLFFSPYSISLALALAYAGARGETERQMAETLRFGLPQDKMHAAFNALDLSLTGQVREYERDGFLLNVANSVWTQESYGFLPDYLETLALSYGEEVRPLDFRRDPIAASARINEWVAEKTAKRITDLTRLVLANGIYFKAAWSVPLTSGPPRTCLSTSLTTTGPWGTPGSGIGPPAGAAPEPPSQTRIRDSIHPSPTTWAATCGSSPPTTTASIPAIRQPPSAPTLRWR